jgi:hypothetical protein
LLGQVEALASLDADPLHSSEDWLISDVRRVNLQQFCCIGEIFLSRHCVHLHSWRRLHIDGWVELELDRLWRFSKIGEKGDFIAILDFTCTMLKDSRSVTS